MNIYIDESGDLGFSFTSPYGRGGSSRYLTITCLFVPKHLAYKPKRVVKKLYKRLKRPSQNELKAVDLKPADKVYFAGRVKKLLTDNPSIKIFAITVRKSRVQRHIRQDPNILYNYMLGLLLPDKIKRYPLVTLYPDEKSVKVKSGNSLIEYLKIKTWFVIKAKTTIQFFSSDSAKVLNVQFADYVCNMIWNKYERNHNGPFDIIKSKITSTTLFF